MTSKVTRGSGRSSRPILRWRKWMNWQVCSRSGMNTIPLKDARGAQWTKLIFNAATNPVGGLTLLHHGAATRFATPTHLFNDLIAEGESVARALGIELHGDARALVQKG